TSMSEPFTSPPTNAPASSALPCPSTGTAPSSANTTPAEPQRLIDPAICPLLARTASAPADLATGEMLDQSLDLLLPPLRSRSDEPVGTAIVFRTGERGQATVGERFLDQRQRHHRPAQPGERRAE